MDSGKGAEIISVKTPSMSSKWDWFGHTFPRQEVVYFSQIVVILIVTCVSLGNLTHGQGHSNLWVALLSSCIGYILHQPSMSDGSLLRHTVQQKL